jgi:protein-tyrosine phosphatase
VPEARLSRNLDWDGCFNARDLGGLRTVDGGETRRRAVVRSESLDLLTPAGWAALRAYGVRTIVDLRNEHELVGDTPEWLTRVHVPLDDLADTTFWQECWDDELDGTPLYYRPFLERKPERCAAAIAAVARAEPGGVLVHCVGGRDRTGLVVVLLLALAGVEPEEIVADYELSNLRLPACWAARGEEDQRPLIDEILTRKQTSARALLLDLLEWLDAEAYVRSAGLGAGDVAAVRSRLLAPVSTGVIERT